MLCRPNLWRVLKFVTVLAWLCQRVCSDRRSCVAGSAAVHSRIGSRSRASRVESTIVLAGSRCRTRSVMRLCGVCFVVVVMVLLPLFADGRVSDNMFFFIAAWVLFERVNGQGKTDIRGGFAPVCAMPQVAVRAKILFFCAWGRALDSADDGLLISSSRRAANSRRHGARTF